MKDTTFYKEQCRQVWRAELRFRKERSLRASETFRAVGYGHSAGTWKEIMRAYMEVGYQGIFSVEN